MEKVSVIIPTYNRADKILKSIDSVLQQSYTNIEVIVVDDASTDCTQAVVEGIEDARVRYIKLTQNGGAAKARNEGVKYAEGKIIAFHDSDDVWHADKLEKQMAYWKEHPEFSMIYCQYNMNGLEEKYVVPDREWGGEFEGDIFAWLLMQNTVGAPTMLMYRDCFEEVGGFDATLRSLEDWEFALKFAELYYIGYVEEPLVEAFYSEGGVSSGIAAYYESRCKIIARYKEQMLNYGIFDIVVRELFESSEKVNLLESVKNMLLLMLDGEESV